MSLAGFMSWLFVTWTYLPTICSLHSVPTIAISCATWLVYDPLPPLSCEFVKVVTIIESLLKILGSLICLCFTICLSTKSVILLCMVIHTTWWPPIKLNRKPVLRFYEACFIGGRHTLLEFIYMLDVWWHSLSHKLSCKVYSWRM